MREALELARRGLESVSPNPMVGAVIVRRGKVLARGYHRRFGGQHAEVEALQQAKEAARGADLYVNLEPCGHHGKTPPCAEAIVRAGIRRVCYAVADPNPLTRGRGLRCLRRAGIEVCGGLLRREAALLNAPYLHFMRCGRPWVVLKWAMTLDGKIATASGESQWITGPQARAAAHSLRRRVDAILVGTTTALKDNPRLSPRPPRGRHPWRVVLDRRGRLPLSLELLREDPGRQGASRICVTSRRTAGRRLRQLAGRGLTVLVVPEAGGALDLGVLFGELGRLGISQVLVEGGGALAGSCIDAGLVQEVAAFVAPSVLGGRDAPSPAAGRGAERLALALELECVEYRPLGRDLLIQGRVRGS